MNWYRRFDYCRGSFQRPSDNRFLRHLLMVCFFAKLSSITLRYHQDLSLPSVTLFLPFLLTILQNAWLKWIRLLCMIATCPVLWTIGDVANRLVSFASLRVSLRFKADWYKIATVVLPPPLWLSKSCILQVLFHSTAFLKLASRVLNGTRLFSCLPQMILSKDQW